MANGGNFYSGKQFFKGEFIRILWYGIGEEIETSVFVTKIEDGEMYQGYIPEVSRSYDAAGQCSVRYRGIIYWTPRSTYQLPLEIE